MNQGFDIRRATPEDLDQVTELRRSGVRAAFSEAGTSQQIIEELIAEIADPNSVEYDLSDPHCFVFLAFEENRPVGTAALRVKGINGHLFAGFCSVRGRGVGTLLMNARIELAKRLKLENLWMEVDSVNAAGTAHAARHSFRPTGARPGKRIKGNSVVRYELGLTGNT